MSEAIAPLPDSVDAILDAVAQMDFALARKMHERAMAAQDNAEIATLARTYQGLTRSLRQTLALKAKLAHGRLHDRVQYGPQPKPQREQNRIERRVEDLIEGVARVAWNEFEDPDWNYEAVVEYVADRSVEPDFGLRPLDEEVVEVCGELDFCPDRAARWRTLPPLPEAVDHGRRPRPPACVTS